MSLGIAGIAAIARHRASSGNGLPKTEATTSQRLRCCSLNRMTAMSRDNGDVGDC